MDTRLFHPGMLSVSDVRQLFRSFVDDVLVKPLPQEIVENGRNVRSTKNACNSSTMSPIALLGGSAMHGNIHCSYLLLNNS